jgi:HK97 family phage prohead protease/HK97 family phage major capsid protein
MNKIFHLVSSIKAVEEGDEIVIRGMASTTDKDRMGDIIESDAWKGGLANYRKNPVILFNHDHNRPIGKAKLIKQVDNGLELEAKISKAAGEIVDLIKDGVLGAFSVGFMVKDADYDSDTRTFFIKKAELLEVSVVSIPANQSATFSIKKSFDSSEEYNDYVKSFSVDLASGQLADDSDDDAASNTPEVPETGAKSQENIMDEAKIQEMMKEMADKFKTQIKLERAEEKAAEEQARKAAEEQAAAREAEEARIAAVVKSGAEELIKDLTDKFSEKEANFEEIINTFKTELEQKSEELEKMRTSRYVFSDRASSKDFFQENAEEIVDAHLLGTITRKGWNTSMGKDLLEKATNANTGVQAPSSTEENFETIVSTTIERDIELELVLAPLFRTIQMNAASMVIPTMPDAGYAEFLVSNAAGSGAGTAFKGNLEDRSGSPGANTGVTLGSKVLTVEKLVSKSYIADETEEDAIMPILPLIRESMTRAHARAIEHSLLLGGHATDLISSQYTGLCQLAVGDSKTIDIGSPGVAVTAANLLDLRQRMGKYGRRPGDVIYVVSLDAYYDLLDDAEFQNINEVGSEMATKVRGQIGQVYGSPVIVCDEFPAKTNGNPFAIAVNPMHFVMPILRGMTVETDRDVENQRRVLVSTQRRGFDQVFTAAGQVVVHNW